MTPPARVSCWFACALCALAPVSLSAEPEAGQIYVHTARLGVTINGGKSSAARPLARGELFAASGQAIDVAPGRPLALVLSNGVAAYMPDGGRLTLAEFTHETIPAAGNDRNYEPSRSQVSLNLDQGELVLAGRKSNPTSTVTLATPLAKFVCRGQALVATVTPDTVTVTLLEGTAEVTIPETGFKETLQANQTATISRAKLRDAYPLKLANLSSDTALRNRLKALTERARWAEDRVDFTRQDGRLRAQLAVPLVFTQQASNDETRFR